MILFLVSSALATPRTCFTMEMMPYTQQDLRSTFPVSRSSKEQRDAYGLPNVVLSDNFALRWGDDLFIGESQSQMLIDELENVWKFQINEMNFPAPYGTDSHLFNIYLGDSGSGAPSAYGNSGYYSVDNDGWPMIVLNQMILDSSADQHGVLPHEFFHAVQHACETYDYLGDGAWYWEATAMWIESQIYPNLAEYAVFLFGFAFRPHFSMSFFDYPDTGSLQEFYQYGAFVFPKFLTDFWLEPSVVRDSWVEGGSSPLAYLADIFEQDGISFGAVMGEFAARNAFWDYPDQDWYLYYLDYYADAYRTDDLRVAAEVYAGGASDWKEPPRETLPERYGYNHIRLTSPTVPELVFSFEGDGFGSANSPSSWSVTVVQARADSYTYHPMTLADNAGNLVVSDLTAADTLILSVLPWTDQEKERETFAYRYKITPPKEPPEESIVKEQQDCGCATASKSHKWLLVVTAFGLLRRRSRLL